ncbi:MAG: phosphoribosylamine--glycine ligase [Thermoleophilia bacterium]|nr:phosphoribosylamine--glycine ligase [Thermoleophilia bacterium]
MDVLLVGAGAREHALAWALRRSPSCGALHAAPGNPGIARLADCHPVAPEDTEAILELARSLGAGLVVIGPEAPLVAGLADTLRRGGVPVFGPSAAAARIEGSKAFAKDVMEAAGVPTAKRLTVPVAPCVVKADGLAAGKGVVVCRTQAELEAGLEAVRAFGEDVVVEELLEGPEVSLLALCDGRNAIALPLAQDFKRAYDGDEGPNTGGMGSFAPASGPGAGDTEALLNLAIRPVLTELARRGTPFTGTLFAGLMLTPSGPRVLEYNCRFGDPETQSVLPLVEGDLLAALAAAAAGDLGGAALGVATGAAVTVVLAAGAYPERGDRGTPIEGIAEAEATGALVFHAGTALVGGRLVTNGGRLLAVTARGANVAAAREAAYRAASLVRIDGSRRREDIADPVVRVR